ncbi:hypothetical protein PVT71_28610 (plasmid) [Salipiger sp. H15]|uniref:Uncharacterized protein n=1 Tax=Alloyangia sp. H15 TaxID=3029062 RepID=A0AAU8AVB0_9RHOB
MSPEKMKAFLDEFALLSEKHGIEVTFHCGRLAYVPLSDWFEGYDAFATRPFGGGDLWAEGRCRGTDCVESVNPAKISQHERLMILGRKA